MNDNPKGRIPCAGIKKSGKKTESFSKQRIKEETGRQAKSKSVWAKGKAEHKNPAKAAGITQKVKSGSHAALRKKDQLICPK